MSDHLDVGHKLADLAPLPEEPAAAPEVAAEPVADSGREYDEYDDEGRLLLAAGGRNPVDIADDVATHLLAGNDPPRIFSMSPAAVLLRDGALVPLDADGWLLHVARRVTFTTPRSGEPMKVAPPYAVMKLVPSIVIPELPALDGIATTPYFDEDGSLISVSGYHPGSRRLLHTEGLQVPPVSETPSRDEVAEAVELLTTEWLGDFPFASDSDKANAVAVLLTLTGRMFFALAPLFVVDASTPGSGKGLLVSTISLIATGEAPQVMELPKDGEEQRKKITSALLDGHELIMWDESHVIQGRTLAAILTAERYSDRLLGGNKLISVTNRFTQVALGNNVQVWGDMKRRVVPMRLIPDTEHPEHRRDFLHSDLAEWVHEHRGELLGAVLTIWRNWIALGRPHADDGMGSFERWARAVGGALTAAGIPGFRANTSEWLSYSEDDDGGWSAHLTQLRTRFTDTWFTSSDVAAAVDGGYLPRPPVKRDPDKTLALQIAYAYRGQRDKWHGNVKLVRSRERDSESGGYTWSVCQRSRIESGSGPACSGSPVSPVAEGRPTEHPGDAGHGFPDSDWCEGCRSTVDTVLHAVNCLGQAGAA